MYAVDDLDSIAELHDLPQCSVGAPCPVVLAGEHCVSVAYFLENTPPGWDGTTVRVVGPDTRGEPAAVVRFVRPYASMFGPPNDEAFAGHPLARRGLHFHDTTFECVATGYTHELAAGPLNELVARETARLAE